MPVTNDETTGRTGRCAACGEAIEEALLLKGLPWRDPANPTGPRVPSPGFPRWRTTDRGPGSARCEHTLDGEHVPMTDL